MGTPSGHTTRLQRWLEEANRGDDTAWGRAIGHACDRLRELASRMLRTNRRVRRWSDTDDLLQNALIRLHRSLSEVRPESVRQFYGLTTTHMRRELIDLARKHFGAEGVGANHHTDDEKTAFENQPRDDRPQTAEAWAEFHEEVQALPEDEREIVDLLWYEGLTQPEAAGVLGISLATLKRRWQSARLRLREALDEEGFR